MTVVSENTVFVSENEGENKFTCYMLFLKKIKTFLLGGGELGNSFFYSHSLKKTGVFHSVLCFSFFLILNLFVPGCTYASVLHYMNLSRYYIKEPFPAKARKQREKLRRICCCKKIWDLLYMVQFELFARQINMLREICFPQGMFSMSCLFLP